MSRNTALAITQLTKHQYYYLPKISISKGKKKTLSTYSINQLEQIDNNVLVKEMIELNENPDLKSGYQRMTYELKQRGYLINHKKVYRLMNENALLQAKPQTKILKNYAQYRIVQPSRPLEVLEMDIKMVWVCKYKRHASILSIIDTFTRKILYWCVGYQMKTEQVKHALEQVITQYLQPANLLEKELHIELRNDNGKQFSAHAIQNFLQENFISQVFTHPYTPQENGHVESFHSILKKALQNQLFWSLEDLEQRLTIFYHNYNYKRNHASIANLSPYLFEKCWEKGLISRKSIGKYRYKFQLKVPYQHIRKIIEQEDIACPLLFHLQNEEILKTA